MTESPARRGNAVSLALIGIGLILSGTILLVVFAAARAGGSLFATTDLTVPASVAFPAPDLSLQDLTGRTNSLADYRGRVVLVNLWATWCPPCRAEMPAYERFYQRHRDLGFTVVAINDGESREDVVRFVMANNLSFPIWLDPGYQASEVAFHTSNLPSSYVIDRDGIVRLMWIGEVDETVLEKFVAPIIEE